MQTWFCPPGFRLRYTARRPSALALIETGISGGQQKMVRSNDFGFAFLQVIVSSPRQLYKICRRETLPSLSS